MKKDFGTHRVALGVWLAVPPGLGDGGESGPDAVLVLGQCPDVEAVTVEDGQLRSHARFECLVREDAMGHVSVARVDVDVLELWGVAVRVDEETRS